MERRGKILQAVLAALLGTGATVGCKEPAPMPVDLAKAAESARAAAASASAAAPTPAPEEPLTVEAFKAQPPSVLCAPTKSEACYLDNVGGVVAADDKSSKVTHDGTSVIIGWAADVETKSVPPVLLLELIGAKKEFYGAVTHRMERPDVASVLGSPTLAQAGFRMLASFADVDPGEYLVQVVQVTASGNSLSCTTRRKIAVE
jgi:hypothetical protein